MPPGLKKRGLLDTKECWKDWIRLGSLGNVQAELLGKGLINKNTGSPPTKSAIEKSAFAWAIQNQEEAKKDLAYAWQKEGVILEDEDFRKLLVSWAKLVYRQSPKRFNKFVSQNGLQPYA